MPQRSAVSLLPNDVKEELNRRLIAGGFSGYQELTDWLDEQGFSISRSSLHRYGQKFEDQLHELKLATEQARAIAENAGDDENALGDALTRLAQQKAFKVLLELQDPGEISLPSLGRMIADLNRSSVTVKRYMAEVKDKVKQAAEVVKKQAIRGGLSEDVIREIEEQILGIVR